MFEDDKLDKFLSIFKALFHKIQHEITKIKITHFRRNITAVYLFHGLWEIETVGFSSSFFLFIADVLQPIEHTDIPETLIEKLEQEK